MERILYESDKADEVIRHLEKLAESGCYVFRGYGKQEELLPNIIRAGSKYAAIDLSESADLIDMRREVCYGRIRTETQLLL